MLSVRPLLSIFTKTMIRVEKTGTLLTAESTPYSFGGNEGTSHKVRVNVEGEIYSCKSDAAQVSQLKQYEGKQGTVTLSFESRKENLSCRLIEFVKGK